MKEENIRNIVNEVVAEYKGLFLLNLILLPGKKIYVEIDGDQPVSVGVCAKIYKKIRAVLQEQSDDFFLEVTTPNIDKPMVDRRQYKKNIGKKLQLILNDDSTVHGLLKNINEDGLLVELNESSKKTETTISFSEIKQGNVMINFKN